MPEYGAALEIHRTSHTALEEETVPTLVLTVLSRCRLRCPSMFCPPEYNHFLSAVSDTAFLGKAVKKSLCKIQTDFWHRKAKKIELQLSE